VERSRAGTEPNLGDMLDLVALGTVADVVPLDFNNRVLVTQGLRRIRAGRMQEGVRALFAVAGHDSSRASGFDLGFLLGPRLNAAGRLSDMSLGIECLITADRGRALQIARQLDDLNRTRRTIEADMQAQADELMANLSVGESSSISLYDPGWHQGVVGILAGRVKDRAHRPTFAFAPAGAGEIRGSGRSIAGLHLRDALDLVAKREPGLLLRFGGHAAAAGLTLRAADFARFAESFEAVASKLLSPAQLARAVETDGSLESAYLDLGSRNCSTPKSGDRVFPQPMFCDEFEVLGQRVVGEKHLKLKLARAGRTVEAMHFNSLDPLPSSVRAAYRLSVNEFNGMQNLQPRH